MAKNLVLWMVIFIVLIAIVSNVSSGSSAQQLTTSEFIEQVKQGGVRSVEISDTTIYGVTSDNRKFVTEYSNAVFGNQGLQPLLEENQVTYNALPKETESVWTQLLVASFPILIIIAVFLFFMRQMQGGAGGGKGPMSLVSRKRVCSVKIKLKPRSPMSPA